MIQMILLMVVVFILSSSNWISFWVAMELVNLLILPVLSEKGWKGISFSLWQYLLVQISASLLFLMCTLYMSKFEVMDWNWFLSDIPAILFVTVILMKMGMFPFHGWMLELGGGLPWMPLYWVLSVLKVVPICLSMLIIHFFSESLKIVFSVFLLLSMLVSAANVYTSLIRRVLIYSSMVSAGWGLYAAMFSTSLCCVFFFTYFMSLLFLVKKFSFLSINSIQDLVQAPVSLSDKMMLGVCLANMAGLPPFVGFYLKLNILNFILNLGLLLGVTVALMSLIFVMAYVKLYIAFFLKTSNILASKAPFKEASSPGLSIIVMTLVLIPYILF